jgi:hypothetical protein
MGGLQLILSKRQIELVTLNTIFRILFFTSLWEGKHNVRAPYRDSIHIPHVYTSTIREGSIRTVFSILLGAVARLHGHSRKHSSHHFDDRSATLSRNLRAV